MGAPQYEQAGADIGGTGTTNTIPRWTGPSTLGDSGITDSGTEVSFTNRLIRVGNGNAMRIIGGGVGNTYFMDLGTVTFRRGDGANNGGAVQASSLFVGTTFWGTALSDGVAAFSGNVGIGTASPASRLDVAGTITCDDAGTGLKLPATPGNADTQTLDCYQENTWTPTLTGFGGTNPTVTARYTRVGRMVSLQVYITATGGATFSSTAATTYISLPAGMSPAVSSPGATSNSGIAADGPCVAYTNGNLYLPTFALRSTDTFLNVTYTV